MNTDFLGGVLFVVVFAGIILVHELGHFFTARLLGIEVEEFGVFLPPRLLRVWRGRGSLVIGGRRVIIPPNTDLPFDPRAAALRPVEAVAEEARGRLVLRAIKFAAAEGGPTAPAQPAEAADDRAAVNDSPKGKREANAVRLSGPLTEVSPGTEFTLNWLPLGGFNRLRGEDDPDVPRGMAAASPFRRILVLAAGSAMNLLTAVLVYMALFLQMGVPDRGRVGVDALVAGMPAEAAGFRPGDILLSVAGERVHTLDQAIAAINAHPGEEIVLTVQRGGQTLDIAVTPQVVGKDGKGYIGVYLGYPLRPAKSLWETLPLSFEATFAAIENLLAMPGQLLAGSLSPEEAQLGGPRTIWNLFQQAVARDIATAGTADASYYTYLLIISLTITVGVANLLPFPALDGGRIFLALLEIVMRRRIPARFQMAINGVGLILLLTLLGAFYIKDIISPATITLP